jgi:hypothetical protein
MYMAQLGVVSIYQAAAAAAAAVKRLNMHAGYMHTCA